jgi:anti-sigma regulatory factor (Ser/Thr protein kinase)
LKWKYQSTKRSRSWLATIRIQRREIVKLLNENLSLQPYLETAIQEAYENAKDLASGETNLPISTFPQQFSYVLAEIMSEDFYPGEPANDDLMA